MGCPLNAITKWFAVPARKHAARNRPTDARERCPAKYTTARSNASTHRFAAA